MARHRLPEREPATPKSGDEATLEVKVLRNAKNDGPRVPFRFTPPSAVRLEHAGLQCRPFSDEVLVHKAGP